MEDKMKKMILIALVFMATNVQAQKNRFEQKEKVVTKNVTQVEIELNQQNGSLLGCRLRREFSENYNSGFS
jgi:hypothetical protein